MPIQDITRQVQQVTVTTTYRLTDPNIGLIIANATSAGFTITIYNDTNSGAYHQLVVKVSDSDVSGNTVTIVDAAGVFSTTLATTSAAVILETDATGNWNAVATFPTTNATTAISAADSAGLRASNATSAATSNSLNISAGNSVAASATLSGTSATASVATSQNGSQSLNISTTGSVAASAVLSGVSATASVATSQNASQSLNVSTAQSTAAS
jgi:hypothetical protein